MRWIYIEMDLYRDGFKTEWYFGWLLEFLELVLDSLNPLDSLGSHLEHIGSLDLLGP